MPKQGSAGKASDQPIKGEAFRGEFTRLEREYVLARSILAARHATGMTKRDFAKAIGASKGKLARWERAETIPRLETLQRIADVTGLSFQIGIEPLEASRPSGTRAGERKGTSGGRKRATQKTTGGGASARQRRTRKASTRKSSRAGSSKSSGGTKSSVKKRSTSGRKSAGRKSTRTSAADRPTSGGTTSS
jgi:transcriptional regulator with XRE-family HTH domain